MAQTLHLKETSSTNEYLNNLLKIEKPDEGFIVWTDFQTAGKGQAGNQWESEPGKNLTLSAIFYPDFLEAAHQFALSQFVSLAITDILQEYIPQGLSIKWPNDIYVGNKKIAGILIENVISGKYIDRCIIGIGLNINQEEFLSNAPNPISLKQVTGLDYILSELLAKFQNQLYFRYIQLCNNDEAKLSSDYKQMLFRREGFHAYQTGGESFEAKIKNIRPTGHLVLENRNGQEMEFAFKEVEFLF